jgi:endonuclease/exonuclease/phosphatase family metal-dependent hydrolase
MSETSTLRVLSWNIRHLLGDPLAVHRVLRAAAPDLVCLQEAPRLPWSKRQLNALADATGLVYVAGGRSGAGTAMLRSIRTQLYDPRAFTFPLAHWRAQRRGVVLATAGLPGVLPVRVASVHLGLDAAERLRHVAEVIHRLSTAGLPMVVAGDLNEPPQGPAWQAFGAVVTDPAPGAEPTFSAIRPRRRIDAVLTSPGIETLEYGQWRPDRRDTELASDHLPVLSLIRLASRHTAHPHRDHAFGRAAEPPHS